MFNPVHGLPFQTDAPIHPPPRFYQTGTPLLVRGRRVLQRTASRTPPARGARPINLHLGAPLATVLPEPTQRRVSIQFSVLLFVLCW